MEIHRTTTGWRGQFDAMASYCDVQVRTEDRDVAQRVIDSVATEAWRVERKFSRYRNDNLMARVNRSAGCWVETDAELDQLLDYAGSCWESSQGLFDVTAGVLREIWRFTSDSRLPDPSDVASVLPRIGWNKIERRLGHIKVPKGMQLDFGGICKEYAVDRAQLIARQLTDRDILINFGGDLVVDGLLPWTLGVEGIREGDVSKTITLTNGAVATSGDTRKFMLHKEKRYGHILNPLTGWPVAHAPRSVTVISDYCTQAGMFATLSVLHGERAETFLNDCGVRFWCLRD